MKNVGKIIFVISIFVGLQASASVNETTSMYQQIQKWYTDSDPVSTNDIPAPMSGRCYDRWSPWKAGAAAIININLDNGIHGPGFSESGSQYLSVIVGYLQSPNFFDAYNFKNDPRNIWEMSIDEINSQRLSAIAPDNGSLKWTRDEEPNGRPDLAFSLRRFQSNYVLTVDNLNAGATLVSPITSETKTRVPRGPIVHCYFFTRN